MKKQIIVTMLLAAALGTVSPSMKAEAKWKAVQQEKTKVLFLL